MSSPKSYEHDLNLPFSFNQLSYYIHMNIQVHSECHEPTPDVGGKLQEDSPPQSHPNQGNSFPSPLCVCKLKGDSGDNALYTEGNFEVNQKDCRTAMAGQLGTLSELTSTPGVADCPDRE